MDTALHRSLAIATYNRAQDLLQDPHSADAQSELLSVAFASRYHWRAAGGQQEWAIADWAVSRAALASGDIPLGLHFAQRALDGCADTFPAWLRASLLEGVARAHQAAGNAPLRDEFIVRARLELAKESDLEDAAVIERQLAELG